MKLKHTVIFLIASNILLFATGLLAFLVSVILVNWFPWLNAFGDYLISTLVTVFMGIICYCICRRITLVLSGITYCIYLGFLSTTWCSINGQPVEAALLRWLLGTINAAVLLAGIGLVSGNRSWIRLTRK